MEGGGANVVFIKFDFDYHFLKISNPLCQIVHYILINGEFFFFIPTIQDLNTYDPNDY